MLFRVAVVATACEFPGCRTPSELWSTVLHSRRDFRRIPPDRLSLAEYPTLETDPDGIYPIEAALLEDYHFDRERFRIPLSTFERTDLAHWLALDVATRLLSALSPEAIAAERDNIAVIVANTLTGEFSRAHALRYRWPYVERVIRGAAKDLMADNDVAVLLAAAEKGFKAPFPAPDEDSLAGGLSNTIAGRIANYHGLRGGAHTVDGACASSLVAVTSAYERLALGDAGCALVGAVDLSLDPFELVGFARNGALARSLMRVFDKHSDGFWPGEGCGFLLMATEQVVARHDWPVLAWIRGAAMSTDGEGALTRPTVDGQALAARRAWARANRNPAAADYFEAHGTGTPTGDPVELAGLASLIGSGFAGPPIPVGSIKANIGHTKAAAGIAGLLKAISVCRERIIPATTGCFSPHPILDGEIGERIEVRAKAERVLHHDPILVGVNAFGFGGVNCHVVVEGNSHPPPQAVPQALPAQMPLEMGAEVFQLSAASPIQLARSLEQLARRAGSLSRAQLADLAHALDPGAAPAWRACVVAATPDELEATAAAAARELEASPGVRRKLGAKFSWSCPAPTLPRIGFLFPGQGNVHDLHPLPWVTRFACLAEAAAKATALLQQDVADTAVLQPLLAEVSIAGLDLLGHSGIDAQVVLGHSFGELPALYASGQLQRKDLRALAHKRGASMREHSAGGAMLAVRTTRETAIALAENLGLALACENGARRFVLAGDAEHIRAAAAMCAARDISASILPTQYPFHSPSMDAARAVFAPFPASIRWLPRQRTMVSSITGRELGDADSLAELLARQFTAPVKFTQALAELGDMDLLLEVGAGEVLTGLAEEGYPGRVLSLDMFGASATAALAALGAAWVCGAPLKRAVLYERRSLRPCTLDDQPAFLSNPCGVPSPASPARGVKGAGAINPEVAASAAPPPFTAIQTLRSVVAELAGLPSDGLDGRLRLLADLHLNSIRARHAVALAAQRLGLKNMPFELARLANASLDEAAAYLDGLIQAQPEQHESVPAGVAPWLRCFTHQWVETGTAPSPAHPAPQVALLDDRLAPLGFDARALLPAHTKGQPCCSILVLPATADAATQGALLDAVQRLLSAKERTGLLVLQGAQLANAFLRSVAAELSELRFCAVEYESCDAAALRTALEEYRGAASGYSELRLRGARLLRRTFNVASLASACARPWSPQPHSVLLVTGGARGIGAASARALARSYGCRLALLGRSADCSAYVVDTLSGMRAEGLEARYFRADLTDPHQARAAVCAIESTMGPVRALLHAAGLNQPVRIRDLNVDELGRTVASKVDSLKAVLECIPASQLELVIGYGSIIGELGLAGEAHYALANEWLGNLLEQVRLDAPNCRVLQLAWSAWREVGMAARLDGVLDGLRETGTRALDTEEASNALLRALHALPTGPLIISGRFGRRLDAAAELRALQSHRYLERPMVFYPGVELIADALLLSDADRYLQDHAPFAVPLFPLACAIEAMLSAAQCLHPSNNLPAMEFMRIGEGIAYALGQRFHLRTCALAMENGTVKVELRCETTGYEVVHFQAVFAWPEQALSGPALAFDGTDAYPASEVLYQGLCFHGPRFQRLATVLRASATECQARTACGPVLDWCGPLLPQQFQGGAPPVRDAVLHALQLCVPHQLVLPVAAAHVQLGVLDAANEYLISARQTSSDGTRFVFDIDVSDQSGQLVERWRGLELMRAPVGNGATAPEVTLAPMLLEPLVGRLILDVLRVETAAVGVIVGQPRLGATRLALTRACGTWPMPEPTQVTASHADDITIALASSRQRLAVDLQCAPKYSTAEWRLMLGEERARFAMRLVKESIVTEPLAFLYVWALSECLIKLGIDDWPLASATQVKIDAAFIGPVLKFTLAHLCLAVTSVNLSGRQGPAAVAVGQLAAAPARATLRTAEQLT